VPDAVGLGEFIADRDVAGFRNRDDVKLGCAPGPARGEQRLQVAFESGGVLREFGRELAFHETQSRLTADVALLERERRGAPETGRERQPAGFRQLREVRRNAVMTAFGGELVVRGVDVRGQRFIGRRLGKLRPDALPASLRETAPAPGRSRSGNPNEIPSS
jgi:hypothetical protein